MHIHIYIQMKTERANGMAEKTRATIVVEQNLWKEFKKLAIDREMQISELVEKLVSDYLDSNGHSKGR